MNKRRLLKLADLLEADAKNKKGVKFDMGDWGGISDAEAPMSCGTTVCAMGLAAISGAFKRAGLGYINDGEPPIIITMNGRPGALKAAAELFDISDDEAHDFFIYTNGKGAVGERTVAKKIRNFVAGKVSP